MATSSAASLRRMTAATLSQKIIQEHTGDPTFAIVDVRDDDYIGGHIKGSTNVPSKQLDAMMPALVRKLKDKALVVFHCALSQQRGPSAALRYLRERDDLLRALGETSPPKPQEVYVLDRGFEGWQETYGEDLRLTEGYRKDLWQDA